MSEQETSSLPEKSLSEIKVPSAPSPVDSDIVASKPEALERQSAVIGTVERAPVAPPAVGRGQHGSRRGPGSRGQRGNDRRGQHDQPEESGLFEKVVHINRCAKVVAGGRRFSFSALVVVGDQAGNVGIGYGKAKEVPECIRKGTERAKRNMRSVSLRNNTIPHQVLGNHDGGRILLRPAVAGTGLIAGGGVRAVLEAAGVKDVLTKSLRSNNPAAMVFATMDALNQLRSGAEIARLRRA